MFLSNGIKSELCCYQNCYQKLSFCQMLSCKIEYSYLITLSPNIPKSFKILSLDEAEFHHVPFLGHCTIAFIKLCFSIISSPALKNLKRNVHKKHAIARIYSSLNQIGCSINEDPWEDFHLDLCVRNSFFIPMQLIFFIRMDIKNCKLFLL